MTYDLKIERLVDAPAEIVFDTIVDPAYADDLYSDQVPGWAPIRFEVDLRVGGKWEMEFGPRDGSGPNDVMTNVFTQIERPRLVAYDGTMFIADWGRTVTFSESVSLEEQDGKTLVTVLMTGLASEADRDSFMEGVPSWVDSIQRVSERRVREKTG